MMLNSRILKYSLIYILIFLITPTYAAFNDIGVGTRPLGLGGAFVAIADDSNAPSHNAAGLAYIQDFHIGATHAQRFNGLITYNMIAGIIPLGRIGTLGTNIGILSEQSAIYREQTIHISYATTIIKQLSCGLNLKYLSVTYDDENEFVTENTYFANTSSSSFSLDLGIMAKIFNSLDVGTSVANIIPADLSISNEHTDTIPLNIRAGLMYRLESIAGMSAQGASISKLLNATFITIETMSRNGDIYTRGGIELWVNRSIGVRGGYSMKNSGNPATTISFGGSAKIPISNTTLQLDYGFQILTGDLRDNTTQRFSVNLVF